VNAVNPTVVLTPMGKANWSDPAKADMMLKRIPLGKFVGRSFEDNTISSSIS
jgi:L-xylulose reductase